MRRRPRPTRGLSRQKREKKAVLFTFKKTSSVYDCTVEDVE